MAFVCQICPPPYKFDYLEEPDGSYSVSFFVGHDPERSAIYFVLATLSPFDEDAPEFSFSLVEIDPDTESVSRKFVTGSDTRTLFSGEDRYLLLNVVLSATLSLLQWRQPRRVYRCTNDRDLPPRAMKKHHLISWAFEAAGYTVTEDVPWCGQRIWWADRRQPIPQVPEDC